MAASARTAMSDYAEARGDWEGMPPCPLTFSGAKHCHFGTAGKGKPILVIGDSHTEEMIPRLRALGETGRYDITLLRLQGCSPIPGTHWTGARSPCNDFADKALNYASEHKFSRVVLFAAWAIYFPNSDQKMFRPDLWCEPGPLACEPLTRSDQAWTMIDRGFGLLGNKLRAVRASGAETVLILPQPNPAKGAPDDFYRQSFFSGQAVIPPPIQADEFRKRTSRLRALMTRTARYSGSIIVDPLDTQCPGGACPVQDKGHYLFKDTHHIRSSLVMTPQLRWFDDAVTGD